MTRAPADKQFEQPCRERKDDAGIALAAKSFEEDLLSIGEAARRAGMSVSEFIDLLGKLHIPVTHYAPGELGKEIDEFG